MQAMITDGFMYIAALVFIAAILVNLPRIFKGKGAEKFFQLCSPHCADLPGTYDPVYGKAVGSGRYIAGI